MNNYKSIKLENILVVYKISSKVAKEFGRLCTYWLKDN